MAVMKIELDEKRIMLEHKYSLEKMWDFVDEICSKRDYEKKSVKSKNRSSMIK